MSAVERNPYTSCYLSLLILIVCFFYINLFSFALPLKDKPKPCETMLLTMSCFSIVRGTLNYLGKDYNACMLSGSSSVSLGLQI